MEDLLKKSDYISLHVPSSPKPVLGAVEMKMMKAGACIINTARGGVIDESALLEALNSGHLGGAGLDAFLNEPTPNPAIMTNSKISVSPHIGGSTEEAQQNIGEDVSNKLFQFLEMGGTLGSHTIPSISLPPQEGTHRILHIHRNVPGVLSEINTTLSKNHINILAQYLKTNEEVTNQIRDGKGRLEPCSSQLPPDKRSKSFSLNPYSQCCCSFVFGCLPRPYIAFPYRSFVRIAIDVR